jgi:plasmid stability protein
MAEGEHLSAELRIRAGADEHEIGNKADELIGEAEKHASGSCPIAAAIRGRDSRLSPRGVTRGQRLGAPIELTPQVLRHRRAGINDAPG